MMVSETIFPPLDPVPPVPPVPVPPATVPVEPGTVMTALELTGPLNAVVLAVIAVVPELTAVTSPEAFTVATAGRVELQVTAFVISFVEGWLAFPNVPVAASCTVWPTARD
jgi:hypothetical protein